MKYLIYLGHPHHYLTVKHAVDRLAAAGDEVLLLARHKDVLLNLLAAQSHPYEVLSRGPIRRAVAGRISGIANREMRVWRCCRDWRPDLLVGTDLVITHIGRLRGIPSLVFSEDDSAVVPLMAHLGYRFANRIFAPASCDLGAWEVKKIAYRGYQELAYLRPEVFQADANVVRRYGLDPGRYSLLRVAQLTAHHDVGKQGVDDALARRLVAVMRAHGDVYISSERPLPDDLAALRLPIEPADIHHVLGHAQMLVGDSQTMTTEASVLGTPAVRYNDFVGEIGCMTELETRYRLAHGIKPGRPDELVELIQELFGREALAATWEARRQVLLAETDDVTEALVAAMRTCAGATTATATGG